MPVAKPPATIRVFLLVMLLFLSAAEAGEPTGVHWPSFRGPSAGGVADGLATPSSWNVEAGENVKWKTPIPGLGHSSPIIWGDRVFVTTAVSGADDPELKIGLYGDIEPVQDDTVHTWHVYCLDKGSGEILWERKAAEGVPKTQRHPKSTHANSTPATDGKHVVAFFGSEGLYCYDMDGNLLWQKDLGVLDACYYVVPSAQFGFGSSPIIHEGRVFVQCDIQKGSFVAAFDIETGEEVWRTSRQEVPTWSTPTIHCGPKRTQLIVNGYKHIGGYDAATGQKLWKLKGGGDVPVPTPVVAHDLIFIANAHGAMAPLYAIRTNAKGLIFLKPTHRSAKYVGWFTINNGAYMQTPLVYGDYIYSCRDSGILVCYEAKTGEQVYRKRLGHGGGGFTASPVAANGKIYFTSEDGDVYVVKAGPEFEEPTSNPMGEVCMATPAISEGVLFFRTKGHLVAVGEGGRQTASADQ